MRYDGKEVLVIGMARSGVAVAELLHDLGARVTINDAKPEELLGDDVGRLRDKGIRVIAGGHPLELIHDKLDFIVKNPVVKYSAAPIELALSRGIPVITEVEIAYQTTKAPIIGITGSNGKTTTTALTGLMMENSSIPSMVAGNIGVALSKAVRDWIPGQWIVDELSSFQLVGIQTFRPRIATILNVYPSHLDYHGTMEAYLEAKWRIFQNQTTDDFAVLNADQPLLWDRRDELRANVLGFSTQQALSQGAFVRGDRLVARIGSEERDIAAVGDIAVPGIQNLENALAATLLSLLAGCDVESIRKSLREFKAVEHRLEFVKVVRGVTYVNDSKATNMQAAATALKSYDQPIVWIAGGQDRGAGHDFTGLVPLLSNRVKAVVAIGEAAPKVCEAATAANVSHIQCVDSMEAAVRAARDFASAGDVVLLSPACASWDMFTKFEERGSMFKEAVHRL